VYIGIDLALRKIGIVVLGFDGELIDFTLIDSDAKTLNGEELLRYNSKAIRAFVIINLFDNHYYKKYGGTQEAFGCHHLDVDKIVLEGLAFNSPSKVVDLIAANHWFVRCDMTEWLRDKNKLTVIPPKAWQKSIVTKEILAVWAKDWPVIRAKRGSKLTKDEAKANNKSKAEIRKLTKDYLFDSVPETIKEDFEKYIIKNKLSKDSKYDLADAFHLANHLRKKNG